MIKKRNSRVYFSTALEAQLVPKDWPSNQPDDYFAHAQKCHVATWTMNRDINIELLSPSTIEGD